jgi:hypothetical protein
MHNTFPVGRVGQMKDRFKTSALLAIMLLTSVGCATLHTIDRSIELKKSADAFGFSAASNATVSRCQYNIADKQTWRSPDLDFDFGVCVIVNGTLYISKLDRKTGTTAPLVAVKRGPSDTIALCDSALLKQLQINRANDRIGIIARPDDGFGITDKTTILLFETLRNVAWPVVNTVRRIETSMTGGASTAGPVVSC